MSSVMDRIREATARAAAGPLADAKDRPSYPRVAAQSYFPPEAGREEYVARFQQELEALIGKVYGPYDAEAVAGKVIDLILAKTGWQGPGARGQGSESADQPPTPAPRPPRVLSWADAELGCPGLAERIREAGIELVPGDVPNDENHQAVLERLAALEVGLSGAIVGLADTGSIVAASGPGRPRIASLLPPIHIAVLPVSRLYPAMQEWLAAGGADLAKETANLVVISGCSRTSDIELQLTLGMHGPKELHVVLYDG